MNYDKTAAYEFYDNLTLEKAEQLIEYISDTKPFAVKDADISSHNIHYWIKEGLFPSKKGQKRIQLDFLEFVWLKILGELRAVGLTSYSLKGLHKELVMPIDNYALYKKMEANPDFYLDSLLLSEPEKIEFKKYILSGKWEKDIKSQKNFAPLLMLIAEAIAKRSFVGIAVYYHGGFTPLVDSTFHLLPKVSQRRLKTETHVVVSITKILADFLGDERFENIVTGLGYFSSEEIKLLELIRSGKYESIKIRFSKKKIDLIELEKTEDVHKRIIDILAEGDFQTIVISQQNGKVTRVSCSQKQKIK